MRFGQNVKKDEMKFDNFRISRGQHSSYRRNKDCLVIGNTNVKWCSMVVISSDAAAQTSWLHIQACPCDLGRVM